MHCKKYIQKSSTITAIKKVIYANKICLALAKEQKLFIYSLDMQKIKEINVYATIHQIIPFNNKFICFSSNYILEVLETGVQKSLIEQHINFDEICHTIDTKNYFMFVYRNGRAFLFHKTDNQHVFEGEINDFYQMNVIDMHAEGNHLYVIHKGQDKVAKPYGNENVYTNYLSYYKYHNKQIILIDSIDIKESYKIVAYNKNIILLDNSSVYRVIMEEIQSQTSKPKETEEGDKQSNRKKPDMRYEYVCKNICSAPTCFVSYLSGVLISCNNTEIIYFDGFKLVSKGFLMREISQIIILQSDKLLGITKDGGSITFDVHDKSNTQKKERYDHLSGACVEKKNPFVSVHGYDNIENIDPDCDQSLSSINVNEYFTSKQLTIIKQSHSKRYDGQIKFIDNNLVVLNKTDPVILTYGLSKKVTNVIKTNERIRKIFCYDDLLFISFFDSFQINNILKNKNVYEHDKSIKNFYALEKSDIKHYSMNTENEFITDQNFYTLDYTIILSAFHKNYKLLYGLKNGKYFLILCEIENLMSEIEVETNISMLYLDDKIYVSTYEDTFTVYDYSFNILHTENRCSFRFCYKVRDNLLFITNSGLFFSFVNKTFVQLFNLDQNILSVCQIKEDVFFVKANKSYIMQFDTNRFSGNSLGKAVKVTQTKSDYSYMTQNKNNLLCVNNRKMEICDNTIDFRIRKKRIQVVKSIEDFVMINERSKLIIEQKVEKDQDKNIFAVVCRYTYNGKRKKTFELQNSIYKTCKLFSHDVYVFVVIRNNGSEIIFCRFGKKVKCLFSKCFDEQIMCATTFDEYLAIGFCNYFTICKFVNNTIVSIYTNKMLPSVIDLAFCNYKDQLYLIVNDAISSFCKFKVQRESNTVEFAEFMDVKVSKLHVYNNMLYSNDNHSISLYDFEANSVAKKIKTEDRIQSMTVGSLLVLDKQKIYVNDSIGDLYALIDICDVLTEEECKKVMELQSKICLNSNILYNEESLNYEILSECINEQLLHEFGFSTDRYAEIIECLKPAY